MASLSGDHSRDGRAVPGRCSPGKTHSLELEGLPQLGRVAGVDLEDAAEGVGVTPVCEFCRNKGRNHTESSD